MQVFLPYPSFIDSMSVLDPLRLNKQILESCQMIIAEYEDNDKFYKNHPARLMWKDNILCHWYYRNSAITERVKRGYNEKRLHYAIQHNNKKTGNLKIVTFDDIINKLRDDNQGITQHEDYPTWFKDRNVLDKVCTSHRKALLIKDFNHYVKYFEKDVDRIVENGLECNGYEYVLKSGKNKGDVRIVSASQHKSEYIRDNNVYFWVVK